MLSIRFANLIGLIALLGMSGCDNGPKVVSVSGTATRNGKPVPSLLLTFQPDGGRPSWGITDANGKFTLEYDATTKGAMVAKHKVTATYRASSPEEEMGTKPMNPESKAVTSKYGDVAKALEIEITKAVDDLVLKFD